MKAAVWTDQGYLDVLDRELPDLRPGWARLKVAGTGICGTDLHFYHGVFPAKGLQPGHEIGAWVDEAPEGAALASGTPVAVEPLITCRECYHCLGGNYARCAKQRIAGVTARGACAEYVDVPSYCLYPLAANVSAVDGGLTEPLAVCVRGTRLGRIGLGQRVVILGAGTIGLMSILTAKAAGAADIHVTARYPHQQEAARHLGADAVHPDGPSLLSALGENEVDCVIETVGGQATTLEDAVQMVRPGGTVVMLGVFDGSPSIPGLAFSTKEVVLVGSNCYGRAGRRSEFEIAGELLSRNYDALKALVTHTFPLDQVNDAFKAAADKSSKAIKVRVTPN
jgi:threonine dehydrogenase-like Zn-dependent dehydrogenase